MSSYPPTKPVQGNRILKQSHEFQIAIGNADCMMTIEYLTNETMLNVVEFEAYLLSSTNCDSKDLLHYCDNLHGKLLESLNTSKLKLKIVSRDEDGENTRTVMREHKARKRKREEQKH